MGHADALSTLSSGEIAGIVLTLVILAIIGCIVFLIKTKKLSVKLNLSGFRIKLIQKILPEENSKNTPLETPRREAPENPGENEQPKAEKVPEYIIGKGKYKCLVLRDGALEPSTINKPLGNIFIADPSMPVSGGLYLVQEDEHGKISAYEPRDTEFKQNETPQWAYFATSWEIVSDIFNYELPWWQSAPIWVTIAVGITLVVTLMIFFG